MSDNNIHSFGDEAGACLNILLFIIQVAPSPFYRGCSENQDNH
ncbi:MAG: hypothetical protein PWQ88_1269 [Candidatus Methanomethylophilaceae archaeon]|nr:hypothetical protein [Candidatus Methanomethylophilaceae archaeon]